MDAVTATTAAGAAIAALVAAGLLVRSRRSRGESLRELRALISELNARLDSSVRELSEALRAAREENRRNRLLADLGSSIDLDEVLSRTIAAATAVPGVDAAVVSVHRGSNAPIVASDGLSAEESRRQAGASPPDGHGARAISIAYEYPPELDRESLIRSGLVVPIPGEPDAIGRLAAYSRTPGHRYDEEATRELEALAARAGPAIENARRFREARRLADLDALTGLHNQRHFHETLAREVARAQRYRRSLALLVLDLDDFKAVNDRIGHLSGDAVLAETAARIRDVVRSADIACRVGGDEFAVVLPESTTGDADQLYQRVRAAVSSRPAGQAGRLLLSGGIAELRPDDDPTAFFERADAALYRAKDLGKGRVVEADAPDLGTAADATRRPGTAGSP